MTPLLFGLDNLHQHYPAAFFWADLFVKASLIVLLATLFQWLYRRQSASCHGLIWLIAIVSCLLLPIFRLYAPSLELTFALPAPVTQSELATESAAMTSGLTLHHPTLGFPGDTFLKVLFAVYLTGLLVMLFNLARGLNRLHKISKWADARPQQEFERTLEQLLRSHGTNVKVTLLVSSHTQTPFTWGVVRHRLVLPTAARMWDHQLLEQAIAHELGHIQRNDWICQLLGRLVLCLYWPNPLLWYAVRCLKIASEKASDDAAADRADSDISYASNLLRLAQHNRSGSPETRLAMALFSNKSILGLRIRHILTTDRNRILLRTDEILVATIFTLVLVVPLSTLRVSAQVLEHAIPKPDYIALTMAPPAGSTPADLNFVLDAPTETWQPPQHLFPVKTIPQSGSILKKRSFALEPAVASLTLATDTDFSLTSEELFRHWEATPLQMPAPNYPQAALRKGIEGFVVAEYQLDDNGHAINSRIIESVPTGVFDKAVLKALEQFVYCPEMANGIGGNNQPIRKRFSFALQD